MKTIKFITGAAGTGKSTKLRALLEKETRPHLIVAPTGLAAVSVGGATIHRTFKIDSTSGLVRHRWPQVEVVYVDEVSMMGKELFEWLVVGAPNASLVFVGDMAQLPPVKDKFWFESPMINDFSISTEKLVVNYRQAKDGVFNEILSKIRKGVAERSHMRYLYSNSTLEEDNEGAITLAYRNDTVRMINAQRLLSLDGHLFEAEATYEGIMKEGDCRAEPTLQLKVGADVIMLNNDADGRWHNGTRATIETIGQNWIGVRIGHNVHPVTEHTWTAKVPSVLDKYRRNELTLEAAKPRTFPERLMEIKHYLDTGIEYVVAGTCKQYPMKLAYAMTVHKAQGMTLPKVNIIMSGFAGSAGIGYVALSRATTLDSVTFSKAPNVSDFRINLKTQPWL